MKARLAAVVLTASATFSTTFAAVGAPLASAGPGADHTAAKHPYAPLPANQLFPALAKYRRYVHARIDELVPEVARLAGDLAGHDAAAAKDAWLTARLTWLRIGQDDSAYGVFGELGQHIDGTAAGHARGVHDPSFTGFHRIEVDLWRGHNVSAAHADAVRLEGYVRQLSRLSLARAIASDPTGVNDFVLRSHEIVEDAVRDTLSGDDEYGSGTALASVIADVDATREVLTLLAPKIDARSPGLVARARRQLNRLATVAAHGKRGGHWVAIRALPRSERERVNSAAGAADETLAVIPELLEG
ncbi:MAG TPA: EfeM/EfeO family lipoprotein [Mycobacteriales bacterium]|nr:EfeM/EfeO family lipoprotein [Mycobacteriales bacterium]HWB68133.1 EfeM/EfeO family lipoprotein [Mycobacteriales bacterium]